MNDEPQAVSDQLERDGETVINEYWAVVQTMIASSPYQEILEAHQRVAAYAVQPDQIISESVRYLTGANE